MLKPEVDADVLENIIDRNTLDDVISALIEICRGKADHLESNWQDANAAKAWSDDAKTLEKAQLKIKNV